MPRRHRTSPNITATAAALRCAAVLLSLAVAALPSAVAAAESTYDFASDGPRYSFEFRFDVKATPDEALEVLYGFQHLKRFSRRASDVALLDEGEDWQTVRFTYSTWLWSMHTTFHRELDRPNRRVRFHMTEAGRTGLPVPLPTGSSGEYQLEPLPDGVRIVYRQSVDNRDSFMLGPWIALARSEAVLFSRDLEAYVRSQFD